MILWLATWLRSLFVTFVLLPLFTLLGSLLVVGVVYFKKGWENIIIAWWARSICHWYGVRIIARRWFNGEGDYVDVSVLRSLTQESWRRDFSSLRFYSVDKDDRFLPGKGGLILFNHASFFDIFALVYLMPYLRFGAKKELFRIPFFSAAMRATGIIPIDRQRRDKAVAALNEAQQKFSKGYWLALAPEGGRKGGDDFLASFKSGPFHLAIASHCAIFPVLIRGAERVWPKGSLFPARGQWRFTIWVDFLPPIQLTGVSLDDKDELKERTRTWMSFWQKFLQKQ